MPSLAYKKIEAQLKRKLKVVRSTECASIASALSVKKAKSAKWVPRGWRVGQPDFRFLRDILQAQYGEFNVEKCTPNLELKSLQGSPDILRVLTRLGVTTDEPQSNEPLIRIRRDLGTQAFAILCGLLAQHGQRTCIGHRPHCGGCSIRKFCAFFRSNQAAKTHKFSRTATMIDLFCGAGGLSVGLSRVGYSVVCALEEDKWACQTYILNHPELEESSVACSDIRKIESRWFKKQLQGQTLDLLVGGPPCQGFSAIGEKARKSRNSHSGADDVRNSLYAEYVKVVQQLEPRILVMENVPGLLSHRDGFYRERITRSLCNKYAIEHVVIDSSNFGVPQHRRRAIFIGVSKKQFGNDADSILCGIVSQLKRVSDRHVTLNEAISDLPALCHGQGATVTTARRRRGAVCRYARKMGALNTHVHFNHVARPLNARDFLLYSRLRPGETANDAITTHDARHLMVYRTDIFKDKYRRLSFERSAPTMMAHLEKDGHAFIHPDREQTRSITVREAARIQSFPDDFIFYAPRSYQFRFVGNAVPPLVAERIGRIIRAVVRRHGYEW